MNIIKLHECIKLVWDKAIWSYLKVYELYFELQITSSFPLTHSPTHLSGCLVDIPNGFDKSLLKSNEVYILDCYTDVFVWWVK